MGPKARVPARLAAEPGPSFYQSSRGTSRLAPTMEILELDRQHRIGPGLTDNIIRRIVGRPRSDCRAIYRGDRSRPVVEVRVVLEDLARPEVAEAELEQELLFEGVPVVDVQLLTQRSRLVAAPG